MNKTSLLSLLRISVGFSFLLISAGLCAGAHHDFQAGKLLDISSDEKTKKGTSHDYAIYQVQIGDIVYFGRGEKQVKHPGDTGHGLIVGDPVQAAIEKDDLIIQRPDGKEIKTKIIKRQRAAAAQ
jgi:co-chaperonin GroES (HSP10)